MKRAISGILLLTGITILTGCGFVFVARNQPYAYHATQSYCYDCHSLPTGVFYSRCNHYETRTAHGGYYYRPYKHGRHEEYRFVKVNGSDYSRADRTNRNNELEKSTRARR